METFWSLIGVALGAGLTYFSTIAFFKEQRKETKQLRQLGQIERANVILHKIDKHVCDLIHVSSIVISKHERTYISGDVSDCFVELDFLVGAYIPKGGLYLIEIRNLANEVTVFYNAVNTISMDQVDKNYELSSLKVTESNFRDSVDHLREEIITIAKQIERL